MLGVMLQFDISTPILAHEDANTRALRLAISSLIASCTYTLKSVKYELMNRKKDKQ